MKHGLILIGAAVLALALGSVAHAETVLRVTLQLPISHHLGKNLTAFKQAVERDTLGEIKVEIYPSAQLYKDADVPQAVASGAVEMGIASLSVFAGTIPAVDLFAVPFLFADRQLVTTATAPGSVVRGPIDAAILETGTRVLWWQAYGSTVLLSKNVPMLSPADMKGKKVRVYDKILGEFVKVLGGAPTLISGSEQYLAYQRGTVDAGMTGVTAVKSRKLYQVMDALTLTHQADIEFMVLINERVWQGLTAHQQAIIDRAARQVEVDLRKTIGQLEAEALAEVRDKMNVIDLTPAQVAQWREASSSVLEAYLKRSGPLGQQLIEAVHTLSPMGR